MLLSEIVTSYFEVLPTGIVLDNKQVGRNLKQAVRFYSGYAPLLNALALPDSTNSIEDEQDLTLSDSEYALIKPLFYLYCELENAMNLESSRALGIDVYGRSVSEIQGDIRERETAMAHDAAFEPIVSI